MTDKLRAAAQAALEHIEFYHRDFAKVLIEKLRAALAEPDGGLYLTIVYRDVQPGPECTDICRHPKVSAVSWSHAIDDRNATRAALVEPAVAHEREADTALLRQSLAYVRWAAFGECRTPGWDGPPPTASGLEEALLERLGESHDPR